MHTLRMRARLLALIGVFSIVAGASFSAQMGTQMGARVLRGDQEPAHLPDGDGKAAVETYCSGCHTVARITNSGHTPQMWRDIVGVMIRNGASVPADKIGVIGDYLAANYPLEPMNMTNVGGGSTGVTIKEWQVPTPNSRPHDPLSTPDGAIWYAGQTANLLGRLDPKTGAFKEYRLKTPDSGPHGLVADSHGQIWFTANFKGYIGKLDPLTGEITEYRMPDPAARDPHTPVFDQKGTLWFTVQSGNMVGRLVPQSGEIRLVKMPVAGSLPYGMVISSTGVPFFAEFGRNALASVDPNTMAIREYPLPNSASRPRRLAITSDDVLWYSDYDRGFLGRLDPRSGTVSEWPSPGGRTAQPYGITAVGNVVWYSESGVSPNALVRFDPKTEKFQTWGIPSGGGVVRNMMGTHDGHLVLACSGVDRVALVEIR